jgi:hypothetical protein
MAGQKLYPRVTVKKIVKAHSNCNVSKNADVMVRPYNPTSTPTVMCLLKRFFTNTD